MRPEIAKAISPFIGGLIVFICFGWAVLEQLGERISQYQTIISATLVFLAAAGGLLVALLRRAFQEIDANDQKEIKKTEYERARFEQEKYAAAYLCAQIGKFSYTIPDQIDLIKQFEYKVNEELYDNEYIKYININVATIYFSTLNTAQIIFKGTEKLGIGREASKESAQSILDTVIEEFAFIEYLLEKIAVRGTEKPYIEEKPISDLEVFELIAEARKHSSNEKASRIKRRKKASNVP